MKDILIWGAGAIGGTVGAKLVSLGLDVTFVDVVEEHVKAIRKELRITGPIENIAVSAPAFTPDEVQGKWRRIFLAVKAQHTEAATIALQPFLADDGYVLSLQNGLCEKTVEKIVGRERTIGAFVNFGADWIGPGEIEYGNRAAFVIGELDGVETARVRALYSDLRKFEPDLILSNDVWSYLWGKLTYGAFLTASALGQLGIADCLERPELLPLWRRMGQEILAVAARDEVKPHGFNGFEPEAFAPEATEEDARRCVKNMVSFNRGNAKTHTGVWRDLAIRKRKTEVPSFLGPIVAVGRDRGAACPTVAKLIEMIVEIEDGKRSQSDSNLLELAAHEA